MSALRRTATVAALCAGIVLTAGCQNGDGQAQPLPPAESSTVPSETTTSPSPTEAPVWQAKYSKKEIAAYEAALDRFTTYEQRSEPIWRRGKATPAAEELFKDYFYGWQNQLSKLELYETSEVEIHGTPTVLSSGATRIALADDGQSVTIRQCVDFEPVATYQYGDRAPSVNDKTRPREIVLSRSVGAQETPWRISALQLMKGTKSC